jgi:hypothetical protein
MIDDELRSKNLFSSKDAADNFLQSNLRAKINRFINHGGESFTMLQDYVVEQRWRIAHRPIVSINFEPWSSQVI